MRDLMIMRTLRYALLLLVLVSTPAVAGNGGTEAAEAQQGFKEILEFWRAENYEGLFVRLEHPPGQGWPYFAQRIVYGSRIPACCWEMLQDITVTVLDADNVVIKARVGLEVEGVGTRFVVRDFTLHRSGGVWKLPMHVVLELADYNFQRIPRKVYEISPRRFLLMDGGEGMAESSSLDNALNGKPKGPAAVVAGPFS